MNIYKLLWCGVLMFFYINSWGQDNILLKREITWHEPAHTQVQEKDVVLLDFTGMAGLDDNSGLPYYFESIALPANIDLNSISISIKNQQFIWPLPSEHVAFKNAGISKDIPFKFGFSQSKGQFYADITITPLKMEEGASSFQKLKSFDIIISYTSNKSAVQSKLKSSTYQYATHSVLAEGNWKKISVTNTGIHKITYTQLANWGISNPENVGIYGNGGKLIPTSNILPREDDLVENAVWHYNNAIYFYAEGPVTWKYDYSQKMYLHTKHPFSDKSYYFITQKQDASKSIPESDNQPETYEHAVNTFVDYNYHEENEINLIGSGSKWFGKKFEYYREPQQTFNFSFPNIHTQEQAKVKIGLASRSGSIANFKLLYQDTELTKLNISAVDLSEHLDYFAREGIINKSFIPVSEQIDLTLAYNNSTNSIGYLDYICINATRELQFEEDELLFRYANDPDLGENMQFNLSNSSENIIIWDITDPLRPQNIIHNQSGNTSRFNYNPQACEFVAFDPAGSFETPKLVGAVENQDLHGLPNVEYLIVCDPDFIDQAERLGKIHNEYNGLTYAVVTDEQIYNEFSSGKKDVTAIRSFAKMFYDRTGSNNYKGPQNLLLFGDGSYDNRPGSDEGRIITYQSINSLHRTNSYVSDDYFGLLDDIEGSSITSEKLDIGIGRFPVNTVEEAKIAVDKTRRYLYEAELDTWKNTITFVGDDGDSNIHMKHANSISEKVDSNYPQFDINKIFFDAYTKEQNSTGGNYPEVEEEIYNALHEGTLVFNYTGHGGTGALSHEHVITYEHIKQWQNYNKLPIFITATCEFSRYDDHEEPSAGELVFTHELGGGIALYSTTRIVYSSLNKIVNDNIYDNIFELNQDGQPLTLGEIMKRTKNASGSSVNKLNFTLLGDPAIQPIFPRYKVNTLTLNNDNVTSEIDALLALSTDTITGEITDGLGQIQSDFNGEVYINIFDKKSFVTTLDNLGIGTFQYEEYDNIIFKGRTEVVNGKFEIDFIVPKDIRYNFDNGKISYYAFSDDNKEAFGAFDNITIGGMIEDAPIDEKGPDISLYINDRDFTSGSKTGPTPILIADFSDENGINTTGIGIGHDITCVLDGNKSNPIILNDYFESELNNYRKGTVTYQLPQMESGVHHLKVKAWDTYNNSSESEIEFKVSAESSIKVSSIKNYPNPVAQGNTTYFYFEHDEPNSILNIDFNIYTLNGELVKQFDKSVVALYNTIPPIEWTVDLSPGIYLYELVINSQTGRKGKETGKIMVVP